jgi:hypothetical protein
MKIQSSEIYAERFADAKSPEGAFNLSLSMGKTDIGYIYVSEYWMVIRSTGPIFLPNESDGWEFGCDKMIGIDFSTIQTIPFP